MTLRNLRGMYLNAMAGAFSLASLAFGLVSPALAQTYGHAVPGQMGMQLPVTPVAEEINSFHNLLLVVITVITLFVLALLVYVIVRFNEKANPTPSRTTHSTVLEVAWTIVPVLILVVIAIPSFRLLTHELVMPNADVTIKVTGRPRCTSNWV